jgi:hypothetical protein
MKTNYLEIDYKEYNEALEKSLFDESWVKNLYYDKENIVNFFKRINETRYLSFAANFMRHPDIKRIVVAKSNCDINNRLVEQILDAGSAKENLRKVNEIKSITNYYANIVTSLLNEYSENTRNFINGVIKPYPENIEDTWKPIKSFRITTDDCQIAIKILNNKISCDNINENLHNYFDSRNKCKDLKRAYLKETQLSHINLKNIKRELLNLKEVQIPTNYCQIEKYDAKYKVVYKGNQTVKYEGEEVSISGNNIKIYQILELK